MRLTCILERERFERLLKFGLVGGSLALLGIVGLYFLVDVLSIQKNLAYFLLTVVSLQLNFILSDKFTWSGVSNQGGFWRKWVKFHMFRGIVAGLNQLLFALFILIGLHYMVANLACIAFATGFNFLAGEFFVFRSFSSFTTECSHPPVLTKSEPSDL